MFAVLFFLSQDLDLIVGFLRDMDFNQTTNISWLYKMTLPTLLLQYEYFEKSMNRESDGPWFTCCFNSASRVMSFGHLKHYVVLDTVDKIQLNEPSL